MNAMNDYLLDNENDENTQDLDGHRDRIRRQILLEGLESLKPLQILEFLLYYALPRQDVEDVALQLMDRFGDLRTLFHASLDDFRQVEILGEGGAQWMDMLCRCMNRFAALTPRHSIVVDNQRRLLRQLRRLRRFVKAPCCMQLLTDRHGCLLLRKPVGFTLEWAQQDVLREAMEDVSSVNGKNAYLIVFTDDCRRHPGLYDRSRIADYAALMQRGGCQLQDVVFADEKDWVSMRRLNLMPDLHKRRLMRRYIAEDEMQALLDRELKIIIPNKEDYHDRSEPV